MEAILSNLLIILSTGYVVNACLSVLLAATGRNFRGAWLWVVASTLMALGTIADSLPLWIPQWIPLVLGNTAYTSAAIFFFHSSWIFRFTRPFPIWIYLLIPIQVLSFALVLNGPYLPRALMFSFWMALGAWWVAFILLFKVKIGYRLANFLTALPFLILSVASILRIFLLMAEASRGEVIQTSPLTAGYVAGATLLSTITLFGYFMMTGIKSNQVLQEKDGEIARRNQALTEANRSKDLFFAIIAHDLRGPIGGAARYTRKHLGNIGSGGKETEAELLASSLEKTNEFLEKLLWWSKAQLSDWSPPCVHFSVPPTIQEAMDLHRDQGSNKHITIIAKDLSPVASWGDPESVKLIVANLLSNAIKFSHPDTTIQIQTRVIPGWCIVGIQDQGIGMDHGTMDRLFRIEDKISTLGTAHERGSGLGLILARSLAERNGGRITMESKLGHGTTASLWLRTDRPREEDLKPALYEHT